ncbi:uncharacterized protein LOC112086538 [Eutrema salsugineum]|uniref:uncharacterized protein LOC112086538 n=1 Tax=Eutrema salsugineum TaxID=72664 RepID=UPI000CECEA93|nr:uncharacterized protein LOC112086538 [Eutrema salsugineum]
MINGLRPLCFETVVEFHGGEETTVFLRYEKLFGYCRICYSLCHDQKICPNRAEYTERKVQEDHYDDSTHNSGAVTYKAAVNYGSNRANGNIGKHEMGKVNSNHFHGGQNRGKGKLFGQKEEVKQSHMGESYRYHKGRTDRRYGEGSSRSGRPTNYAPPKDLQYRITTTTAGVSKIRNAEIDDEFQNNKTGGSLEDTAADMAAKGKDTSDAVLNTGKQVRKSLVFDDEGLTAPEAQETKEKVHEELMSTMEENNLENKEDTDHDWDDLLANDDSLMDFEIEGTMVENFQEDATGKSELVEQGATLFEPGELQLESDAVKDLLEQEEGEIMVNSGETDAERDRTNIIGVGSETNNSEMGTIMATVMEGTEVGNEGNKPANRKKIMKGSSFVGGTSKKRMVQALISPRKKQSGKGSSNPKLGLTGTKPA